MDALLAVSDLESKRAGGEPADRWASRRVRARIFFRERGVRGLIAHIRAAGLRRSGAFVLRHVRYSMCIFLGKRWDRAHGVDTGGQIELRGLEVVGPNADLGYPAVSTSPATFRFLSRYFPAPKTDWTFVDLGCAKGRTLLLAAQMGFGRVIGVEFAGALCEIARSNIARFSGFGDARARCSVSHADATQYEFPDGKLVLYFGNPFGLELWPVMLANIETSLRKHPRPIRLIVTGSLQETIEETGVIVARSGIFSRIAKGVAPFFLDTYLPYHYEVFEVSNGRSKGEIS
jgi:SAM-dependent methyltransferase